MLKSSLSAYGKENVRWLDQDSGGQVWDRQVGQEHVQPLPKALNLQRPGHAGHDPCPEAHCIRPYQ